MEESSKRASGSYIRPGTSLNISTTRKVQSKSFSVSTAANHLKTVPKEQLKAAAEDKLSLLNLSNARKEVKLLSLLVEALEVENAALKRLYPAFKRGVKSDVLHTHWDIMRAHHRLAELHDSLHAESFICLIQRIALYWEFRALVDHPESKRPRGIHPALFSSRPNTLSVATSITTYDRVNVSEYFVRNTLAREQRALTKVMVRDTTFEILIDPIELNSGAKYDIHLSNLLSLQRSIWDEKTVVLAFSRLRGFKSGLDLSRFKVLQLEFKDENAVKSFLKVVRAVNYSSVPAVRSEKRTLRRGKSGGAQGRSKSPTQTSSRSRAQTSFEKAELLDITVVDSTYALPSKLKAIVPKLEDRLQELWKKDKRHSWMSVYAEIIPKKDASEEDVTFLSYDGKEKEEILIQPLAEVLLWKNFENILSVSRLSQRFSMHILRVIVALGFTVVISPRRKVSGSSGFHGAEMRKSGNSTPKMSLNQSRGATKKRSESKLRQWFGSVRKKRGSVYQEVSPKSKNSTLYEGMVNPKVLMETLVDATSPDSQGAIDDGSKRHAKLISELAIPLVPYAHQFWKSQYSYLKNRGDVPFLKGFEELSVDEHSMLKEDVSAVLELLHQEGFKINWNTKSHGFNKKA